jgi:hypothetical protein
MPLGGSRKRRRGRDEDFFPLWKDADPDIPILKQAKAEYAKLKQAVSSRQLNEVECPSSQLPCVKVALESK